MPWKSIVGACSLVSSVVGPTLARTAWELGLRIEQRPGEDALVDRRVDPGAGEGQRRGRIEPQPVLNTPSG